MPGRVFSRGTGIGYPNEYCRRQRRPGAGDGGTGPMSKDSNKMSLTMQIMLAMGIGLPTGILLNQFSGIGWVETYLVSGLFNVVGSLGNPLQRTEY